MAEPKITFETTLTVYAAWNMVYLPVPNSVASKFTGKGPARVVCTIAGAESFQAAIIPFGDGDFYIYTSKHLRKKLGLQQSDTVTLTLEHDDSPYGAPVPEELAALFEIDDAAHAAFEALTPGKQRSVLHQVGSAKRSETRINRALRIVENLKAGITDPRRIAKENPQAD